MKAPRLKATSHVVHLGRRIIFKDVILGFLTRENLIDQDKGVLVLDSEKLQLGLYPRFCIEGLEEVFTFIQKTG